jgi:outer membrane protein OmpA-like peptidoglycan-associated protein
VSKIAILGLGVILWGALLSFCVPHEGLEIQQDIAGRGAALLARLDVPADRPEDTLRVDGRDVTLTGYEGSREVSDETVRLMAALPGVRSVHTQTLARPAVPKAIVTPQQAREAAATIRKILKAQSVEFYVGTDKVTATGARALDQVAAVLKKYPGMRVEVTGKIDASYDLDLCRRRGRSVREYLVERGVADPDLREARRAYRQVEFHTKGTH